MASLSMSVSGQTVYFTISGLSAAQYVDIGVASEPINSGTQIPPSGICYGFGNYTPPPTSVSGSFTYSPGTYTFYAYGQTLDYYYWSAGSYTVTIEKMPFSWDVAKTTGSSYIGASEWNRLINFISDKVGYFVADYATVGYPLTAAMYNQLINGMRASSSYLVSAGDTISAEKLNLLVTLANSL